MPLVVAWCFVGSDTFPFNYWLLLGRGDNPTYRYVPPETSATSHMLPGYQKYTYN